MSSPHPVFNSYLEVRGERMRFVIDAQIERAEVPKLQQCIACMAGILALLTFPNSRGHDVEEPQFPDEGIAL